MAGSRPFLAHVRPRSDGGFDVHELGEHLSGVAELAARFASRFGNADWARLAGLWHDLGKYHPEFQRYIAGASGFDPGAHLEGAAGRVDHSTLGAVHALDRMGDVGRILAYIIAGHHAGLPDWESVEEGSASLIQRTETQRPRLAAVLQQPVPPAILTPPLPSTRPPGCRPALWIRMLFSCLVDADFLDTEAFMEPQRGGVRGAYPEITDLHARLDAFVAGRTARLAAEGPLSPVNQARADVLRQCREKAGLSPGIFSLSVPTGGGKTISSLVWALEHARAHGKRRVIYVIPFTSIVEQTADVFREALGANAVVEHHSSLEPERESAAARLAAENWDAPLVVTTGVQFWESLFAARPSRCRKLHNIADSVVVLDEAQTLPPEFLLPILDAVRGLTAGFGGSFLLCTATQPALESQRTMDWKFDGLTGIREIIDDPASLHARLRRVDLHVPADLRTPMGWEAVASEMAAEHAALCIVNRRDDARDLYRLLPTDSRIHLSALMCGKHRSRTIRRVRRLLRAGRPVHLVSTQLVEAGVDLDFPVVFRALAGLDSIAQAAGRCNREGRLERGRTVVFVPPRPAPPGLLRQAEDGGRRSLQERSDDPLAPDRFRAYFRELYWKHGPRLDRHGILPLLDHQGTLEIRFRGAAERFRLIDDAQLPVVVRYRNHTLLRRLRHEPVNRHLYRRLQRFVVSIPAYLHQRLRASGEIEEWQPGVWVQAFDGAYDPHLGLFAQHPEVYDPADLIG